MKTKKWLWLLLAAMVCTLYACSDEEVGYESSPDWATEGGYKVLESIHGKLTKEAAWEIVKDEVFGGNTETVLAYVLLDIVKAKTSFETADGKTLTTPNYDSWMFFIDDHPGGNLSGIYRYAFVKTDGSYIQIVRQTYAFLPTDMYPTLLLDKQISSRASSSIFSSFNGSMNIS